MLDLQSQVIHNTVYCTLEAFFFSPSLVQWTTPCHTGKVPFTERCQTKIWMVSDNLWLGNLFKTHWYTKIKPLVFIKKSINNIFIYEVHSSMSPQLFSFDFRARDPTEWQLSKVWLNVLNLYRFRIILWSFYPCGMRGFYTRNCQCPLEIWTKK